MRVFFRVKAKTEPGTGRRLVTVPKEIKPHHLSQPMSALPILMMLRKARKAGTYPRDIFLDDVPKNIDVIDGFLVSVIINLD
jgi:hypothetical protein